jgi:hypothetical protein
VSHQLAHTSDGAVIPRLTDVIFDETSFANEIQPLYPNLTADSFASTVIEWRNLIEPLSGHIKFFIGSTGFISYNFAFNGWEQYETVTDYEQIFLFDDQAAYSAWQLQEQEKGNNRISKWYLNLEEKSINFNDIVIQGTQMIDTVNGETSDMSLVKYLTTKYFILRKTQFLTKHVIE